MTGELKAWQSGWELVRVIFVGCSCGIWVRRQVPSLRLGVCILQKRLLMRRLSQ